MINVELPDVRLRRLPFYLAMEEWVARAFAAEDYLFMWRVEPTVICGRNQDMSAEVNMDYCRDEGIDVVRRRSGGGCVYADQNNFMFSFVAPGGDVSLNFARYTAAMAGMLRSLGFDATVSGRNDLLVDGLKVSGSAFYRLHDRSIVHGTMLYDIDAERMSRAITPSRAKLEAKGVKSVPSRVTSLKNLGIGLSLDEFGRYAVDYLCQDQKITLTATDIAQIEELEQRYYDPAFLRGRSYANDCLHRRQRIEGIGEFDVKIELNNQKIKHINIGGDYFAPDGGAQAIEQALEGCCYDKDEIAKAVHGLALDSIIHDLKHEQLLNILI